MRESITYMALDTHRNTITGAALPGLSSDLAETKTIPTDLARLVKWLRRLERKYEGELQVCDEASGADYVLYRAPRKRGITCSTCSAPFTGSV